MVNTPYCFQLFPNERVIGIEMQNFDVSFHKLGSGAKLGICEIQITKSKKSNL
jgi:hypothetical protein